MNVRHGLFAAALLATTASAAMPQPASVFDLQQLPATQGKVAQYSVTPRGDVDGVILDNGVQVHLPPHLGHQLVAAVKPGDMVTVHGLKARVLPLIRAGSITDEATHKTVEDSGPPPAPPRPLAGQAHWMQVKGTVREPLYGPRGEINGALLQDGTQIHLPPNQAQAMAADLQPGKTLVAQGYGVAGPYGKSIGAHRIGESEAKLVRVGPPGPHGPHGHRPPPPGDGAPPPPPPG